MKPSLLKQQVVELFKNKKMLVSIIAILFIPILYSGTFLWAFWDPYSHLEDLPVAIVNNDKGAEMEGEKLQLGDEFVDKLKESKDFDFQFVNRETGYRNLENQKYYLLVEIPENFSENATTLMDEDPQKLQLKYVPNESFNFLSAQIGETAVAKIQKALSEKVTETYAETMFDIMTKLADGYESTDKAAGKLKDGIMDLDEGAKTLEEKLTLLAKKQVEFTGGTKKVHDGTVELQKGAATLADGLSQLANAQNQLIEGAQKAEEGAGSLQAGIDQAHTGIGTVEEKMNEVVSGTDQIHQGSEQLEGSLQKFQTGANSAAQGAKELEEGVAALQSQLEPVMPALPEEQQAALKQALAQLSAGATKLGEGNETLASSAGQIESGASTLSEKIATLNNGQKALQTGISELSDGTEQLKNGAAQLTEGQTQLRVGLVTFGEKLSEASAGSQNLAKGSTTLVDGVNQLQTGSTALADGSSQLAEGSSQIVNGTNKLAEGSTEFKDEINEAATEASEIQANDKTYNMVAEPVTVEKESINKVPNYGTGIAPYFLSLGLFVGALILSIVFPYKDPVDIPRSGFSWFTSKLSVITVIGTIQALIASGVTLWVLDMDVQSVPLFILYSILTSLVFITLVQLLVTTLGDPGRFIAILILILQLTTSAGTFPIELVPQPLQDFNGLLPMAYTVRGYKEVISSGNFSLMWQNGYVLIGFMVSFMVLTLLYFVISHKKKYSGVNELAEE
ncbi:YhgE/Pip domain-containing protein [Peribacillus asahii]|uniref:Membrane protein n=1 Tax=Peribacillus asahii TaxID=228899 RepID=A0A3Q9RLM6_9BACI|nr:YhgE/Pip domain-containing protein [Peribacillus asahii]AZV41625.1 membrane protein [Peribacillus asahii]USK85976.1 YhgE/Pip domain-containing protein [Peribacillus asahii]